MLTPLLQQKKKKKLCYNNLFFEDSENQIHSVAFEKMLITIVPKVFFGIQTGKGTG